jgi:hypothetical protein
LNERKLAPVRLTQVNQSKPAKARNSERLGGDREQPLADRCHPRVSSKRGDSVMVLVDRDAITEEPALEKARQKFAEKTSG